MRSYTMQFQYIDENLNRIMQNPDSVMYLRPYDIGNKKALFAVVREEQGIYKKIQITKEQSKMIFPIEPMCSFYNGPGYLYLNNFIVFDNDIALNITNLEGFKHKILEDNKLFNIGIFATFNDGSATFVTRNTKKEFQKKGGIQSYIDLLKQHKEYEPKYNTYKYIEGFNAGDNTFVIPELLSPTSLKFEEVDYQDLLYKDVDVDNAKTDATIPLDSVQQSIKKLSDIKRKNKSK